MEAEIAPLLEDVPKPKQKQIFQKIEEVFAAVVQTSHGPKLDPESMRSLTATIQADNDNKFRYLSQKEQHDSEHRTERLAFQRDQHRDRVRLLWPILVAAILVVAGLVGFGVWFIWAGRDAIGIGLLTSIGSAIFGFLGGIGVANFFKNSAGPS